MEHRWGARQPTDVKVRFVSPSKIGTGRLLNISVTGAFMKTKAQMRLLSVVDLLPAASRLRKKKRRRLAACVVRQDSVGVGLEWCETLAGRTGIENCLAFLAGESDAVKVPAPAAAIEAPAPEPVRRTAE
jgi:hypothetical protein